MTVDYCICAITKLPFLVFLFHCLSQFEALGGMDLSFNSVVGVASPLPLHTPLVSTPGSLVSPLGQLPTIEAMYRVQEESMPLQGSLWALNDLATRLSRLKVPLYPATVSALGVNEMGEDSDSNGNIPAARTVAFAPLSLTMSVRQKYVEMNIDRDGIWQHFAGCMEQLKVLAVDDETVESETTLGEAPDSPPNSDITKSYPIAPHGLAHGSIMLISISRE